MYTCVDKKNYVAAKAVKGKYAYDAMNPQPYKPPSIVWKYRDVGWPRFFTPEWLSAKVQAANPINGFEESGYMGLNAQGEAEYLDDNGHLQSASVEPHEIGKLFKSDNYTESHSDTPKKYAVRKTKVAIWRQFGDMTYDASVLDDHLLKTSLMLLEHPDMSKARVTVYNYNKGFEDRITVPHSQRPTIVNEDILKSLQSRENIPEHLFLDFCATPINTLFMLTLALQRNLLPREGGIAEVTVSTHCISLNDCKAIVREYVKQAKPVYDYMLNIALEVVYGQIYTVVFVTGNKHVQTDFSLYAVMYQDYVREATTALKVNALTSAAAAASAEEGKETFESYLIRKYAGLDEDDNEDDDDNDDDDDDDDNDECEQQPFKLDIAVNGFVRICSNFDFFVLPQPLYMFKPDFLARHYSKKFQGQMTMKMFESLSNQKQTEYYYDNLRWLQEESTADDCNERKAKRVRRS